MGTEELNVRDGERGGRKAAHRQTATTSRRGKDWSKRELGEKRKGQGEGEGGGRERRSHALFGATPPLSHRPTTPSNEHSRSSAPLAPTGDAARARLMLPMRSPSASTSCCWTGTGAATTGTTSTRALPPSTAATLSALIAPRCCCCCSAPGPTAGPAKASTNALHMRLASVSRARVATRAAVTSAACCSAAALPRVASWCETPRA